MDCATSTAASARDDSHTSSERHSLDEPPGVSALHWRAVLRREQRQPGAYPPSCLKLLQPRFKERKQVRNNCNRSTASRRLAFTDNDAFVCRSEVYIGGEELRRLAHAQSGP